MKKIAMILCAAMILTLACAACSGGSGPAGNSSGAGPAPNAAGDPPAEGFSAPSAETGSENGQADGADVTEPDQGAAEPDRSAAEPEQADPTAEQGQNAAGSRILVAYFSATNNTEGAAQKLADGLGADLYEIMPAQPYTDADLNYGDPNSRTSAEMNDPAARPAISGEMPDLEQYDVVFIGYPIWWGEAPRIMSTFVESCDFSGKTLAAFCTSASSGFGSSDAALRAAVGTATWLDGRRFSAGVSAEELLGWANELGIQYPIPAAE